MHTGYLRNCVTGLFFFLSLLHADRHVNVYSGVSVYLATVQYIVHSLSER